MLQALGGTPKQGCAAEINKCAILQNVAFVIDLQQLESRNFNQLIELDFKFHLPAAPFAGLNAIREG